MAVEIPADLPALINGHSDRLSLAPHTKTVDGSPLDGMRVSTISRRSTLAAKSMNLAV
jgi:hypothetical protein